MAPLLLEVYYRLNLNAEQKVMAVMFVIRICNCILPAYSDSCILYCTRMLYLSLRASCTTFLIPSTSISWCCQESKIMLAPLLKPVTVKTWVGKNTIV